METGRENKSITKNSVYSIVKSVCSILIPLIIYKYATNIIEVAYIGSVEYAKSIVNYFILLAGLGIETFAIQRGSAIRDDKEQLSLFAKKIFTINTISSLISIVVLAIIVLVVRDFRSNWIVYVIFAFQIVLSLIGVDWLFYIFEDFKFLMVKTLFSQCLALALTFIFIKGNSDYILYAAFFVLGSYGGNILGLIRSRKYIRLGFHIRKETLIYVPAILILFVNQIATTIYVNSDITMLGIINGDEAVGYYTAASKIYTGIKTIFNACFMVALPKCAQLFAKQLTEKYKSLLNTLFRFLCFILPPIVVGAICQASNMITIVSSSEYLVATPTFVVLSIAIIFSALAMYFTATVLLPQKKEKIVLISTSAGAILNIVLNIVVLPIYGQLGAAITTLLSEFVVMTIMAIYSRSIVKDIINKKSVLELIYSIAGSGFIVLINYLVGLFVNNSVGNFAITFVLSASIFFGSQLLIKGTFVNEVVIGFIKKKKRGEEDESISNGG